MKKTLFLSLSLLLATLGFAEDPPPLPDFQADPEGARKMIRDELQGQTGRIVLPGGQAVLELSEGYAYLDNTQTRFLLERIWGNPEDKTVLGAILPPGFDLGADQGLWVAVLDYSESGHVADSDAAALDYGDLLKKLREGLREENKERKKAGIPTVELVGWAAPPHYDAGSKKLYWAKELAFEGETEHSLNYMIRVLGREGTIDVNIVGSMRDLPLVEGATPALLSRINFVPGHGYADYRAGSDHLAEFGVAGLVLGGIAAKAGIFKLLLGVLAASWKAIALGLAGIGAFLAKRFGRKRDGGPAA